MNFIDLNFKLAYFLYPNASSFKKRAISKSIPPTALTVAEEKLTLFISLAFLKAATCLAKLLKLIALPLSSIRLF